MHTPRGRRFRSVRTAFLALAALAAILTAQPPDWSRPAGVFPLGDERMNDWAAQRADAVVLTGRIRHLSDEQRAKASISAALVTLRTSGQETLAPELRPDGTFRIELPAKFPRQQLWLRVRPLAYLEIIIEHGLHLEIDAALVAPITGEAHPGIEFSGPDGPLNSEVNRYVFGFGRERQRAIESRRTEAARGDAGAWPERLGALGGTRRDAAALLREFAPQVAGWFLNNEIEAEHFAAVLQAAARTRQRIEAEPVWPEIARHEALAVTNDQAGFLRALKAYFVVVHVPQPILPRNHLPEFAHAVASAAPEIQADYRRALELAARPQAGEAAGGAELDAVIARLRSAGVLSVDLLLLRAVRRAAQPLLPVATVDLLGLLQIPRDAGEAHHALAELDRVITQPWLRAHLAGERRGAATRLAAINHALTRSGPASDAAPASTPLGKPLVALATGATLHHWPDLAGRDLLNRLRTAFPGKALVIDFWGPWCSPCLAELPHSERMHAALKGEPVEFVYLGSRTADGPWRRTIADLKLGGTHVLLTNPQVDELMSFFGLGGFPGYAFIDRQGSHRPGVITRFSAMKRDDFRQLLK